MKSPLLFIITSSLVSSYSPALHHTVRCNKPRLNLAIVQFTATAAAARPVNTQLSNSHIFSLDKSTIPKSYIRPTTLAATAVFACALFCLAWPIVQAARLFGSEHKVELFVQFRRKVEAASFSWKSFVESSVRNLLLKLQQLKQQLLSKFVRKRLNSFTLGSWNVCKLVHIKPASEEYNVFRFQLPAYPLSRLGLDIGQEVSPLIDMYKSCVNLSAV